MAFEAKLSIEITHDGEQYFSDHINYTGFEYDGVVTLQVAFLSLLNKLGDIGLQRAIDKGAMTSSQVDKLKALLG